MKVPATLIEAVAYFADPQVAHDFFAQLRWPHGAACPRCGNAQVRYWPKYRRWNCGDCRRQFTAKLGTIFEDSPISFTKWLPAIWMLTADRNGISSCEVARALGVTQKTAWFMLHRIREAMADEPTSFMTGPVEADETYIGGLVKSMNNKRKKRYNQRGRGSFGKAPVMALIERNTAERKGKVRAFVVDGTGAVELHGAIQDNVKQGEIVYTDGHLAYKHVSMTHEHYMIDHAYEYVRGHVHTNSIESFFSVFKRTIKGTYIAPRPKHLQRYVNEQVSRFNERESKDGPRFAKIAKAAEGKRLTYCRLIGGGRKSHLPV